MNSNDAHLVQIRVPRPEAAAWKRAAAREERTVAALVRVAVRAPAELGSGSGRAVSTTT